MSLAVTTGIWPTREIERFATSSDRTMKEDFEKWLTEHDRQIAERAYAEGVLTNDEWDWVPFNPYSAAEQPSHEAGTEES